MVIITKTGKLTIVLLCVLVVLASGFFTLRLIVKDKAAKIPTISAEFHADDIQYSDNMGMGNLRRLYKQKLTTVSETLSRLQRYAIFYRDTDVEKKIEAYSSYKKAMQQAYFLCPEHHTPVQCHFCKGKGLVKRKVEGHWFKQKVTCDNCKGRGTVYDPLQCKNCGSTNAKKLSIHAGDL